MHLEPLVDVSDSPSLQATVPPLHELVGRANLPGGRGREWLGRLVAEGKQLGELGCAGKTNLQPKRERERLTGS